MRRCLAAEASPAALFRLVDQWWVIGLNASTPAALRFLGVLVSCWFTLSTSAPSRPTTVARLSVRPQAAWPALHPARRQSRAGWHALRDEGRGWAGRQLPTPTAAIWMRHPARAIYLTTRYREAPAALQRMGSGPYAQQLSRNGVGASHSEPPTRPVPRASATNRPTLVEYVPARREAAARDGQLADVAVAPRRVPELDARYFGDAGCAGFVALIWGREVGAPPVSRERRRGGAKDHRRSQKRCQCEVFHKTTLLKKRTDLNRPRRNFAREGRCLSLLRGWRVGISRCQASSPLLWHGCAAPWRQEPRQRARVIGALVNLVEDPLDEIQRFSDMSTRQAMLVLKLPRLVRAKRISVPSPSIQYVGPPESPSWSRRRLWRRESAG